MSDPEKLLILELLNVAEKDAVGNFQGVPGYSKHAKESAQRFLNSEICGFLCEFVGGDAGVIRKRVSQPVEGK